LLIDSLLAPIVESTYQNSELTPVQYECHIGKPSFARIYPTNRN